MLRQVLLGLIGMSAVTYAIASISKADEEAPIKEKSKLATAAEAAYQATVADYNANQSTIEDVYQWSLRLMKAELKDGAGETAVQDHVQRMTVLHTKIAALYRTGSRGGSTKAFHASEYFHLEAESMKAPE